MRKFPLPIILLTSLFAREYIAIIDFEGIGVSEGDARALTQRLTSELIKLETYQVLERNEMKRLLEENELRKKMSPGLVEGHVHEYYTNCIDLNCAVEIGKIIGAKFMVVGTVSKVGNAFSVDSRLVSVETSESYISANYTYEGNIESLLIDGMTSIAHQLCELQYTATEKNTQDVNLTNSTSNDSLWEAFEVPDRVRTKPANVARKDSTYKFWSSFSPIVGFNAYLPKYQMFESGSADVSDSYFALRWNSPIKIINKKAQFVLEINYKVINIRTSYKSSLQRNLVFGSHLSIFPIPSVEIRPGIYNYPSLITNPTSYVTGRNSIYKEIILQVDVDYHLPIKIGFAKPIINIGYSTDTYSMNLYLGFYIKRN